MALDALLVVGATMVGLIAGRIARGPIRLWPRGVEPATPPLASTEVTTAVLFAAVTWQWGLDPMLPALLVFVWALVVATVIDLAHQIIPNRLTLRLPFVLAPLVIIAAVVQADYAGLVRASIAAIAVPLVMLLLSEGFRLLRGKVGMGMGDIKLAISIGLVVGYLGVFDVIVFAYAAMGTAVVVAIILLATKRAKLASRIPFGPYLAVGALLPILSQDLVTDAVRGVLLSN